ncbi:MAG: DUF6869 domain-containing protein [Sphingomonas sp.]|uniref:DUF6869 domain-containing protein n=1 Tax=Sphingomonas sp. TaxID=28214 RepID=UPI003F7D8E82
MTGKGYSDELQRALARPDVDAMIRQIDAYADYFERGAADRPDDRSDDFEEIITCYHDDPEKAFAYVIIAAARTDDAAFLAHFGCGPLEDVLRDPSSELLERIVAEARKSARFRWLLSNPFKAAIAEQAWQAIERFRITGPHEEPSLDLLPPRQVN